MSERARTVRELVWHASDEPGSTIRRARFVRRSGYGLERVAAAGRAIGEVASRLVAANTEARTYPPVPLDARRWEALCRDALLYVFRGSVTDAVVTIGRDDARRIAARAFGDPDAAEFVGAAVSRVERAAVDRFAAALGTALEPLCGSASLAPERAKPACSTFVEVRLGSPGGPAIGIGLAREPDVPLGPKMRPGALDDCVLECSASFGTATIDAAALAALRAGDVLLLDNQVERPEMGTGPRSVAPRGTPQVAGFGTLNVGPHLVAAGQGGIVGERAAFMISGVALEAAV